MQKTMEMTLLYFKKGCKVDLIKASIYLMHEKRKDILKVIGLYHKPTGSINYHTSLEFFDDMNNHPSFIQISKN